MYINPKHGLYQNWLRPTPNPNDRDPAAGAPQQNEGDGGNSGCAGDFVDVEHFKNVQALRLTTEDVKMFC